MLIENDIFHKKNYNLSRIGELKLSRNCSNPYFMPVGTYGVVKGLSSDILKSIGCQIKLANTFHLWLSRTGNIKTQRSSSFHKLGQPILTDSGGFKYLV